MLSTINSHAITADMAYAPYGEIYNQFGSKTTSLQMFTGDTQDIVSGTMDTPNRELNTAAQGRWLSPDPAGAAWNQYAYATNPNSFVDPSGLKWCIGAAVPGCSIPSGGSNGANTDSGNDDGLGWATWGTPWSVGSSGGTVGADWLLPSSMLDPQTSAGDSASPGLSTILNGVPAFAAWLGQTVAASWAAAIFQSAPEADDNDVDPDIQWGQALEPLPPGEIISPPIGWQYNLLNPGPLNPDDAANFAGGQYSIFTVGDDGLSVDTPFFRVYGNLAGPNGSWFALVPQTGGIQSMIDLALVPPGANTAENAICVYLAPGTTIAVGPIGSQGGFNVGGLPGAAGLQVFAPPPGYQYNLHP